MKKLRKNIGKQFHLQEPQKINYLGVNLTKDMNDLYKENDNPLKKEIEEDYRRWKDLSYSSIGRINIVKMAILPNAIYMFKAIPIKIPMTFITEIENSTLKFIWKHKRLRIAKATLSKMSNAGGITIPDFKLFFKVIAIKTTWYRQKNRHQDQWNRIEDQDTNPHSYAHLIFDQGAKNIQWRKDHLFNKCCWEKWLTICKKLKLDPCLSLCTSINSKWIKDLNIRPETLKLVHEGARNTLGAIGIGNDFLNRTLAAQQLRERVDMWTS
jgi:hypothetical protein